jgi:hypothetical protein
MNKSYYVQQVGEDGIKQIPVLADDCDSFDEAAAWAVQNALPRWAADKTSFLVHGGPPGPGTAFVTYFVGDLREADAAHSGRRNTIAISEETGQLITSFRAPQNSYAARAVFIALAENLRPGLIIELSGRGGAASLPTGVPVDTDLYERIMGYEGQD